MSVSKNIREQGGKQASTSISSNLNSHKLKGEEKEEHLYLSPFTTEDIWPPVGRPQITKNLSLQTSEMCSESHFTCSLAHSFPATEAICFCLLWVLLFFVWPGAWSGFTLTCLYAWSEGRFNPFLKMNKKEPRKQFLSWKVAQKSSKPRLNKGSW